MNEFPMREPASIPSTKKPEYSKFKKRTMKVLNIQVPVIYKNLNDLHSVNVDFTIRTSSRFARKYLENYEYKLKDHFFSTVEPTLSSFAIKNEGKDVLEAKIKYELQNFLQQNRVEGEVLEVNTISIIAN
jgi:flagellar basal body-associated protein FliL